MMRGTGGWRGRFLVFIKGSIPSFPSQLPHAVHRYGSSAGSQYIPVARPLTWRFGQNFLISSTSFRQEDVSESGEEFSGSSDVKRLHKELMESMRLRCIPKSSLLLSLLQHCSSTEDVKLALEAVAHLRKTRSVQGGQQENFGRMLSKLVVEACLRANDPDSALKTVWAHNIYGFTPSLEAAHQLLIQMAHGSESVDRLIKRRETGWTRRFFQVSIISLKNMPKHL